MGTDGPQRGGGDGAGAGGAGAGAGAGEKPHSVTHNHMWDLCMHTLTHMHTCIHKPTPHIHAYIHTHTDDLGLGFILTGTHMLSLQLMWSPVSPASPHYLYVCCFSVCVGVFLSLFIVSMFGVIVTVILLVLVHIYIRICIYMCVCVFPGTIAAWC